MQFLHDLHDTVDRLTREGVEIVITGDWNIPALKQKGPDKYRDRVAKLFKKNGQMLDAHTACNRTYDQPPNPIASATHGDNATQRHTYHHPGSTGTDGGGRQAPAYTNPDLTLASRSLITNNIICQCATLLDYSIAGSGHLPTMFTINLAAAFDTTRSRFITQHHDRSTPFRPSRMSHKISLANKKHATAYTSHVTDHVPQWLSPLSHQLLRTARATVASIPQETFAADGDPERLDTITNTITPEQHNDLERCWRALEITTQRAAREAAPIPTRKAMKVLHWSVAFVKKFHSIRHLNAAIYAAKTNRNRDNARSIITTMQKRLRQTGITMPPMPAQNQHGPWRNWVSALEREVKAAKKFLHARHRKQAMAEAKDRGKSIEKKRQAGQIKQAVRFALRQQNCYNPPLTELSTTETPDDQQHAHQPRPDPPPAPNGAHPTNANPNPQGGGDTQPSTAPPPLPRQIHGKLTFLHNTKASVQRQVDAHIAKHFSRPKDAWIHAHPTRQLHPITLPSVSARKAREQLHRGTSKMHHSTDPDDHSPLALQTNDPDIHKVFSAFRFKQLRTDADNPQSATDVVDHDAYGRLERSLAAEITMQQLEGLLRSKAKGKAPGESGIRLEHIMLLPNDTKEAFLNLCNFFWLTGICPNTWYHAYLSLIPKDPGTTSLDRMRPISLLEVPRKIIMAIKNHILTKFWRDEGLISEEQYAFTAGKSTIEPALMKKMVSEHAIHHKHEVSMLDIDLSKAYDTVEGWVIEVALRRLGVPYHFINILRSLHLNHKIHTRTGYGNTDGIQPELGGCPQGATESCAIFVAIMDLGLEVTKSANTTPYVIAGVDTTQLMYCDDATYIVRGPPENLAPVVQSLAAFNTIASLQINYKKSFVSTIGWDGDTPSTTPHPPLQIPTFTPKWTGAEDELVLPWQLTKSTSNHHARIKCIPHTQIYRHLGNFQNIMGDAGDLLNDVKADIADASRALGRKTVTAEHALYCNNAIIRPKVMYKLKFSNIGIDDIDDAQKSLKKTLLNKAGCRNTLSLNLTWSTAGGMGLQRLSDLVNTERLSMLLHILSAKQSLARALTVDAVARLQRLTASNQPVLETKYSSTPANTVGHTWVSRLWEWMSANGIALHDPDTLAYTQGMVGTSLHATLQGTTGQQKADILTQMTANRLCTTADLTMRDGRTLKYAVRNNPVLADYCHSTLAAHNHRSLPAHHQVPMPAAKPAVDGYVAWVDHRSTIRYGKVLTLHPELTTVIAIDDHTPSRTGEASKRARQRTAAGPYSTLTASPNEHTGAVTQLLTAKLTAIDTHAHEGNIQVWTDPTWIHATLEPLARPLTSLTRKRVRRRRKTRTISSSDEPGTSSSPGSGGDSDSHDDASGAPQPAETNPRKSRIRRSGTPASRRSQPRTWRRTTRTLHGVNIQQIRVGQTYVYVNSAGTRIEGQVTAVRQGASGSNQTATYGDITVGRPAPNLNPDPSPSPIPNPTLPPPTKYIRHRTLSAEQMSAVLDGRGGGREALTAKYHSIQPLPPDHLTRLRAAISQNRHIVAYTDASYYESKEIGSYGWVVGTLHKKKFTPLAHGAGWENGENNVVRKMSSTRLEKIALLSASAFLTSMHATNATFHADNTTANAWFNNRNQLRHPLYEWHKRAHNDLDACMQHALQAGLPDTYDAIHVRGHVEERKANPAKWSVHEQGNHMADAIAEAAYSDGTHPLYTWELPSASRTTVTINNDQIVDHVAHTVRTTLGINYMRAELKTRPTVWGENLDTHDLKLLTLTGPQATLKARVAHIKFLFGMLATNSIRVQQRLPAHADQAAHAACRQTDAMPPPPALTDATCKLCTSQAAQTNDHVFKECTHPPLVEARLEWAGSMSSVIMAAANAPALEDSETPRKPQPTLDVNLAIALQEIWSLTAEGTVPADWTVGKSHPSLLAPSPLLSDLREDHLLRLRTITKVGGHAWWKGMYSKQMKPTLEAGGIHGRKVNSVMAGLRTRNQLGWSKVYDTYNAASAGSTSAFATERALTKARANDAVDERITDIYQRLHNAHLPSASPPEMHVGFAIPLDTRLTHSLTRKEAWADTQESWLRRRADRAEENRKRAVRAAETIAIHAQNAAANADRTRQAGTQRTKQLTLFSKHLTIFRNTDDETFAELTRTPAAQARHERSRRVLPSSESDTENETTPQAPRSDDHPAPVAPPPVPHPPAEQDEERGRTTKRLRRTVVTRERQDQRQQHHQEREQQLVQRAEARASQALEGAERRAAGKKRQHAQAGKQARKRQRQAGGGEGKGGGGGDKGAGKDSGRSRGGGKGKGRGGGSDGRGEQPEKEKAGAGEKEGHTAGHHENSVGDG
jgi:hypothetical protein